MSQLLIDNGFAPPPTITCLSLDQPYAGLVAVGLKTLETRLRRWPRKTRPYPSPVLICSTMAGRVDTALEKMSDRIPPDLIFGHHWMRGMALCLVDVIGCRPLTAADEPLSWFWNPEEQRRGLVRYAWELANRRRVAPFEVKGRQGFARSVPRGQVDAAVAAWRPA